MLPTTTACTFSTAQRPKILQSWVLLTFWLGNLLRATAACTFWYLIWPDGSAPAALTSLLFYIRKTLEKQSVSRLFYIFVHLDLLSTDTFSSDSFSSLTALISAFPSVHIVGSLTSKLPSIRYTQLCVYIYTFTHIRSSPFAHRYLSCQLDQIDVCKVSGMYPILNPQLGIVYFLNP